MYEGNKLILYQSTITFCHTSLIISAFLFTLASASAEVHIYILSNFVMYAVQILYTQGFTVMMLGYQRDCFVVGKMVADVCEFF